MQLSPGQIISHYKILAILGEGGAGIVYKALDTKLDRVVAIKALSRAIISDADRARFLQEAKAAAAIVHPNVCVMIDYEEIEGHQFIIMEYVEGKTLREIIQHKSTSEIRTSDESQKEKSFIPLADVLPYSIQIAEALNEAHNKGIIHRDMKTDNIMVNAKGQVKVMDFGLAKLKGMQQLTRASSKIGTLAYMSPEQVEGASLDHRTDIFSFGVVMYEMLSGELPFQSESEAALLHKILEEEPPPIYSHRGDIDPELHEIVMKCLEKNVDLRYQTVEEVLIDLKRYSKSKRLSDIPPRAPMRKYRRSQKNVLTVAITAFVVTALVIVGLILWMSNDSSGERISIAVVDFVNQTKEEELNGLSGMLITALEQSQRLSVLTRARMFDILNQLGKSHVDRIDESLGREICQHAGVNVIAIASIRKFSNLYIIDLKILEPSKNEYLFTADEKDNNKENIPALIDKLAERTRAALNEREAEIHAREKRVADMTSVNLEAYQQYFLGEQYISKLKFSDAQQAFKEALILDSTFALASYRLAYAYSWYIDPRREEAVNHALRYIDRVPEKERSLIRAFAEYIQGNQDSSIAMYKEVLKKYPEEKEALWQVGDISFHRSDYETAITYFEKLLIVDPTFQPGLGHIIMAYSCKGQTQKMITFAKQYVAAASSEVAYNFLAATYLMHGDFENALHTYKQAGDFFPESTMPIMGIVDYSIFKEDYHAAEKNLNELLRSTSDSRKIREAYRKLSHVYAYTGKFRLAMSTCDKIAGLDRSINDKSDLAFAYAEKAFWSAVAFKDRARTEKEMERALVLLDSADFRSYLYLAKTYSRIEEYELASTMNKSPRLGLPSQLYGDVITQAYLLKRNSSFTKAAETFNTFISRWGIADPLFNVCDLARCYIASGNLASAISILEKYQRYNFDGWWPNYFSTRAAAYPESYFVLGTIYEKMGDKKLALKNYQKLLAMWKEADEDIPLLDEVKKRYTGLKGSGN